MKIKYIAVAMTSALLTVGLIPLGSAQDSFDSAPVGIEVITVVGKRQTQEGIEVITVVGKRPAPEGLEVITVVGKRPAPEGIEVITAVGRRQAPEGIEVITVVGKRPAPTVASTCVNVVMAGRTIANQSGDDYVNAPALESRAASRNGLRQAIKDCIDRAQAGTAHS